MNLPLPVLALIAVSIFLTVLSAVLTARHLDRKDSL